MNIYEKLAAVQQDTNAPKSLYNSFGDYKYRSAESILEAVKPTLKKYGALICLSDELVEIGGRIYLKVTATFLDQKDGAALQVTAYAGETAEKKKLDASQLTGVASSYARKYALGGLLLLDDTKDADTDEFAKANLEPKANPAADELRELAKKARVKVSDICQQAGIEKLEYINAETFAKVKTALLQRITVMEQTKEGGDGASGKAV